MLLQEFGNRIKRILSPSSSSTPEKQEATASISRQDRAGSITQLQSDVTRLQHEIADLSVSSDSVSPGVDNPATSKHMDVLQRELEQTQQSLAKLQGRV